MIHKEDKLIYIGESNEYFDTGDEVILMEDLSPAAIAGMKNTPEQILVSCMYYGGKVPSICGIKLVKLSELVKKED